MKRIFITLIILASITSCSGYKKGFDCESKSGLGCKSISQVNSVVNQGKIESEKETVRVWVAPNYETGELEGSYEYIDKLEVE